MPGLYPNIEPYDYGTLDVGDGHQVYDTKTPAGRFFFVMASLAQMERALIMERTRAGLQAPSALVNWSLA
jgi:hypothetical protein